MKHITVPAPFKRTNLNVLRSAAKSTRKRKLSNTELAYIITNILFILFIVLLALGTT